MANEILALLYKEWKESLRTYKLLILGAGFLFFAILDPVMLKLLPDMLGPEMEGVDLTAIMKIDKTAAILNFHGSLYQMGSLIIALTLMNLVPGEFRSGNHIIPLSNRCSLSGFLLVRFFFYSTVILIFSVMAAGINYGYADFLFEGGVPALSVALRSGLYFGIYFLFLFSCVLMCGTLLRNGPIAAVTTLVALFLLPVVFRALKIQSGHPAFLFSLADNLEVGIPDGSGTTILITMGVSMLLLAIARVSLSRRSLVLK